MTVFTKKAVDIFAAQDASGAARKVSNHDVQVWGTEVERVISATLGVTTKVQGGWNASGGSFPGSGTAEKGDTWIVTTAGTVDGVDFRVGDMVVAITDNASTTTYSGNWSRFAAALDPVVHAVDSGTGTSNAIEIIAFRPVSPDGGQLISFVPAEDTDSSPVTLQVLDSSGAIIGPYEIKTAAGNDPNLTDDTTVVVQLVGNEWVMLSDQATAALLAAAEDAAQQAAASAQSAALSSAAAGAASGRLDIADFSQLATDFVYDSPDPGQQQVAAGDVIVDRKHGFAWEVAADDATDAHLDYTGSGGVKLYVLPGSSGYDVMAFGADATGSTDSAAAIQKALDLGEVHFPEGQFCVGTKLIYKSYTKITGAGREKTKIISDVIGDSLFAPDNNVTFFSMEDLSLVGNNLTGALGNGHALNLMDAVPGADESAWSPQNVSVRRVYIRGFRGEDVYATGVADKISACGVAIHSGTVINFDEVMVGSCGHGYWLYQQTHVRFYNCTAYVCDKMGVVAAFCEDIVWMGGHVLGCADGTPDSGYPHPDFGSCGILDFHNRNFVFRDGRMKEFGGTSAVRSINSYGSIYEGNDIRADGAGTSSTPNKGIYAIRPRGLSIKKNWFHGVVNSGDKFEYIDISVPTLQPSVFAIEDNVFDNTSTGVAYSVRVKGEGSGNARAICRITGNTFGAEATTLASTVDADIVLDTVRLVASEVYGNSHVAPNNVTKTACVVATTFNNTGSKIGPSDFLANGGTITARYSGLREDVITATAIYDPPSISAENDIAETFSVPGAMMGDIVSVSSPNDHSGVHLSGFVSSAGNVTVVLKNYTTDAVDLGSITLNIRCEAFKSMSI